ncbi:hypothetical protein BV20DRAFT_1056854 [Pilatotrama ljubarskyi]|nr:hypothetical protein BV20DRAFT_1056854 [Pilatotrama ljubarskyi]
MAPQRKEDYITLDDPSPAIPPDAQSAGDDGMSPVSLTKAAPATHIQWTRLWAIPVVGASYLFHLRFRRYSPRRLPLFTSLRPAELHAFAGLYLTTWSESFRLRTLALREDKDLCTIHVAAAIFQLGLVKAMQEDPSLRDEIRKLPNTGELEAIAPSPTADLWTKLVWKYKIAFHNYCPFKVALVFLMTNWSKRKSESEFEVTGADLAYLSVFFADDEGDYRLSASGLQRQSSTVTKHLATGLVAITPLAMLARCIRRPSFSLPLNLVQRLLFYATGLFDVVLFHRYYFYPTTLRNKHALAKFLTKTMPGLNDVVEKVYSGEIDDLEL